VNDSDHSTLIDERMIDLIEHCGIELIRRRLLVSTSHRCPTGAQHLLWRTSVD
jgi:hypothetical protein